ncbi:Hsp20/alpha crystallin family protein [Pontibacter silvestris]|uniref:Hsp20/alpha crystallin family protein n=1 Tax=Pontibacter silvestris TaxID=2305183 RepID=A0ABW4X1Z2_9BACT|nr:Hsp20/alpha crystallin family protein [Pontibacter silvestris]MCC9135748.1 Hsp20/alpha crystallin family protein [Pontibacter silvestris]
MKLIKDKELLRNIAQQIDLLNTIGGGVSETYVDIKKYKKGAVIEVWSAGVNPEAFRVVLHNNQLTIFSIFQSQENPQLGAPLFNKIFMLPPQVDLSRIEAVHQDGQLQVRLPYHDAATQPKEIEIKQL